MYSSACYGNLINDSLRRGDKLSESLMEIYREALAPVWDELNAKNEALAEVKANMAKKEAEIKAILAKKDE
jgi:hypothetical protein